MLVRLQLTLFFVILTVVASSNSTSFLASSSPTIFSTASKMTSPHSLANEGLLQPNGRAGRFSTTQELQNASDSRRLSARYLCRWNQDVCKQEPISFLLGPDCCNWMCTNMKRDVLNCGTCGRICFYGSICCNGGCIDIFNNRRHCGGCHNTCPPGAFCQYGMCDYT